MASLIVAVWFVIGLSAGNMLIDGALSLLEDQESDVNASGVLLLFSLACLIAAPWLLLQTCLDFIRR